MNSNRKKKWVLIRAVMDDYITLHCRGRSNSSKLVLLSELSTFIENQFLVWYIFVVNKQLLKDTLGWGSLLWLIGYVLGIILFMVVPISMIGWTIMPIGIIITLWVLFKKVKSHSLQYFLEIAIIWTLVAIIFDYLFLVKLLKPEGGYYKLDVYLYYLSTLTLPLLVGWYRSRAETGEGVKV